jgi:hypothetical protein
MADINELIDPKVVKQLLEIEKSIKRTAESLNIVFAATQQVNTGLTKTAKTLDQVNAERKEAEKLNKQLEQTTAKLNVLDTNRNKLLEEEKQKLKAKTQLTKAKVAEDKAEKGSIEKLLAANKRARLERGKLNTETRKGRREIKKLNKEIDDNTQKIQKSSDALTKQKMNIGNYGSAFQGLLNPIQSVGGAMRALLANPLLAVMAATVAVFALLRKAMTRSEDGQDRLNKVMAVASSVWDNVLDIITAIGIALFDAFPALLKKTGNGFMIFVNNIKLGFLNAQLAMAKFLGQDEKVLELGQKIADVTIKVIDLKASNTELTKEISAGWSKAIDKAKQFGDEVQADAVSAKRLADQRAEFNREERKQLVENEKLRRQSAELRAESERLKKTDAEAAIVALRASMDLDEEILGNELRLAKLRADNLRLASSLAADDIEAKKEIAQADADVERIQTEFANKRRERTRRENMLRMEALKQDKERSKLALETSKAEAAAVIAKNKTIIDNENLSQEMREEAIMDNLEISKMFAERETEIEMEELNKRLELKLISERDYEANVAALKAKSIAENSKMEIEATEEVNDLLIDYTKDIEQAKRDLRGETINAVFELSKAFADRELQNLQQQLNTGVISQEQYEKKVAAIKTKQAKLDKAQALVNVAISTAAAIMKVTAQTGIGSAVLVPLIAALGAVQAGVILAQPIPQFYEGGDVATHGLVSVGEKGRELIQLPSGQFYLADQPTLTSGLAGAHVFDNKETEQIISGSRMERKELNILPLRNDIKSLEKAVKNKRELYLTKGGRDIRERKGNYYKTYRNRLLNVN